MKKLALALTIHLSLIHAFTLQAEPTHFVIHLDNTNKIEAIAQVSDILHVLDTTAAITGPLDCYLSHPSPQYVQSMTLAIEHFDSHPDLITVLNTMLDVINGHVPVNSLELAKYNFLSQLAHRYPSLVSVNLAPHEPDLGLLLVTIVSG